MRRVLPQVRLVQLVVALLRLEVEELAAELIVLGLHHLDLLVVQGTRHLVLLLHPPLGLEGDVVDGIRHVGGIPFF